MALWRVYNNIKKTPKKVKGAIDYEKEIEGLLMANPELLPHDKKVLWFSKTRNGPGDLVGLDRNGSIVVVEVKKKLGKGEVKKARKQVRSRVRQVVKYSIDRVEKEYQYLRDHWHSRATSKQSYRKQFEAYFGRKFKIKLDKVYRYTVAESSTRAGERRIKKLERRVEKSTIYVVMHMVTADTRQKTISVEKIN